MRTTLLILSLAAVASAAPAPRPADVGPAARFEPAPLVGQAVDPARPAFVPKFAKVDRPPAGRFAERQYAFLYTYPAPAFYGPLGYGYGYGFGRYGGFGFGGGGYSLPTGASR